MRDLHDSPQELDVTGLQCPLPVLKAQRALRSMAAGAELVVLATDPVAKIDFLHYCNESGHDLLEAEETDGLYRFLIRKTARD